MNRRPRILLGVTGSIAAVKAPRLAIRLASEFKADVKVVLTRTVERYFWKDGKACETYDPAGWKEFGSWVDCGTGKFSSFSSTAATGSSRGETEGDWRLTNGTISVHYAEEEWNNYSSLNDRVLHIDLRNWADICIVAPLSAHTLAKIANGMCDDLLTCCLRAWDFGQSSSLFSNKESNITKHDTNQSFGNKGNDATMVTRGKPLILAPAMNTAMWDHPSTQMQLEIIQNFCNHGATKYLELQNLVSIVDPAVKTLACGEVGAGALAELDDIISAAKKYLKNCSSDLEVEVVTRVDDPNSPPLRIDESCTAKSSEPHSNALSSKKESIKKALILFAKNRFREMQTSYQQENRQSCNDDMRESFAEPIASTLAAPISPTPDLIIATILPHLKLGSSSLLIDLGCGDGRWLIAATKMTNCKCLGIDTDEDRLQEAKDAIRSNGFDLNHRVQVRKQDIFDFIKCDNDLFTAADVIVLYLFREAMSDIAPLLSSRFYKEKNQNGEKSRQIVCVGFGMPRWNPILEKNVCGMKVYLYSEASCSNSFS